LVRKLSVNHVVLCFIPIFRGGLGHCSRGRWPRSLSSVVTDRGYNNPDTITGQRGLLKAYFGSQSFCVGKYSLIVLYFRKNQRKIQTPSTK